MVIYDFNVIANISALLFTVTSLLCIGLPLCAMMSWVRFVNDGIKGCLDLEFQ